MSSQIRSAAVRLSFGVLALLAIQSSFGQTRVQVNPASVFLTSTCDNHGHNCGTPDPQDVTITAAPGALVTVEAHVSSGSRWLNLAAGNGRFVFNGVSSIQFSFNSTVATS